MAKRIKSFFARTFDAAIAARQAQANRQVAEYKKLYAHHLEQF